MVRLLKNKDYYGCGLFLLLAVIIGYQEWVSPAIGIFLILFLVEGFVFKSYKFQFNQYTFLFVLLFIFYLAGLLWAEHYDIGLKLLEYKMSFFIFPLIFLLKKEKSDVWLILQGLVFGSAFLAARFFYAAYFDTTAPDSFYEISRQIIHLHPTYATIYFTLTSVFLVWAFFTKNINWSIFIVVPLVIIFCYLILLIGSFAGILFLALSVALGIGIFIYTKLKWIGLVGYVLISPVVIYFIILNTDQLQYDVEVIGQVYTEVSEGKEIFLEKNKTNPSGTKERVMLWFLSTEIILENPVGVGTGDIDFFLSDKCDKYDLQLLKKSNLNPHNQFFQIGIDLGFPGLIYLLFLIITIIVIAIKSKNYLLLFLGFSLLFNGLFESVLQRQSGIVFYTSLICLTLVYNNQLKWKKPLTEKLN